MMSVAVIKLRLNTTLKRLLTRITLPLLMLVCSLSQASMQVSPTQIFVASERNAAGLTLINTGKATVYAQVRVFEWRQQDGEDQLLPSQAIVASPPMLQLAPNVQQLVRIVRNGQPPTTTERSYRILIDEVPVPLDTTDNTPADGLQFRLRYSIPVFLTPPNHITIEPILNTRLTKDNDSHFLHIRNEGNSHAQIADLSWQQGEQRINIAPGLSGYVLPNQQRQWLLPDGLKLGSGGTFTARINGELVERILVPITATD